MVHARCGGFGLQRYVQAFRDSDIDAEVLLNVTAEDLIKHWGGLDRPPANKLSGCLPL